MPEGPAPGCVVHAEVGDLKAGAEAGVYFGYRRFTGASVTDHCACTLTLRRDRDTASTKEWVEFRLRRLPETAAGERSEINMVAFSRQLPPGDEWRRLEIRLTADGARASCQGELLGELSRRDLDGNFKRLLATPPNPVNASYEYGPTASAGLFVFGGGASFRRVVVEPLGQSKATAP